MSEDDYTPDTNPEAAPTLVRTMPTAPSPPRSTRSRGCRSRRTRSTGPKTATDLEAELLELRTGGWTAAATRTGFRPA